MIDRIAHITYVGCAVTRFPTMQLANFSEGRQAAILKGLRPATDDPRCRYVAPAPPVADNLDESPGDHGAGCARTGEVAWRRF